MSLDWLVSVAVFNDLLTRLYGLPHVPVASAQVNVASSHVMLLEENALFVSVPVLREEFEIDAILYIPPRRCALISISQYIYPSRAHDSFAGVAKVDKLCQFFLPTVYPRLN